MVDVQTELRESRVVRLICDFAEREAADAKELLCSADPADVSAIAKLQQRVQLPTIIQEVIQGAILSGEVAEQELNEDRSYERQEEVNG
jgi:hypothetical protein